MIKFLDVNNTFLDFTSIIEFLEFWETLFLNLENLKVPNLKKLQVGLAETSSLARPNTYSFVQI